MSEEHNPYKPPASSSEDYSFRPGGPQGVTLATRGSRLVAAIIDGSIMLSMIMPLMWRFGVMEMIQADEYSLGLQLQWSALSFTLWLLLNGYFLHSRGQSLGKMVMKIKIVRYDDRPADLFRLAFVRMLPMQLVVLIPSVGNLLNLIDVLFIFGGDQRCIHDLIADTKVVMVPRSF